ncbi:hypothetical protein QFC19_003996 [Naganishia cerealis]|uniref:Uncharacterized protein n=1 Tax=Naganishia cerealis TaxID=610337 RepID=A0ACC2VZE0_9TREE|nr:hypothetical protein QFC19_003996 [Naganishia cerealis]
MKYTDFLRQLVSLADAEDGPALALRLSHAGKHSARLLAATAVVPEATLHAQGQSLRRGGGGGSENEAWLTVGEAFVKALKAREGGDYQQAYKSQAAAVGAFLGRLGGESGWCLVVLYGLLNDLRWLSAVHESIRYIPGPALSRRLCTNRESRILLVRHGPVSLAAWALRPLSRSACPDNLAPVTRRINPAATSRRKGVYKIAALSMKCYFKVDRPALCKNLVRATTSDPSIPPLETYPLADQVTWQYYLGLLAFLNGDEAKARECLGWAWEKCWVGARRNQELILTYLIPLHLLNGTFPSAHLLRSYPALETLYSPFLDAIRTGSLHAYDTALAAAQHSFTDMACWMTMERVREVCVRTLFRTVWHACDRVSRVPVQAFKRAMELQGVDLGIKGIDTNAPTAGADDVDALDETECIITTMIYKASLYAWFRAMTYMIANVNASQGYMKGYVSHEKRMVVLAKSSPFPALASRRQPR